MKKYSFQELEKALAESNFGKGEDQATMHTSAGLPAKEHRNLVKAILNNRKK